MPPSTIMPRRRLETGRTKCSFCRSSIAWALTQNGKKIPLNPDPDDGGRVLLVGRSATDRGPILEVHVFGTSQAALDELRGLTHDGAPIYSRHNCRGLR